MCIELERKRFFRFLYYCIISIGCWVIVGQPVSVKNRKASAFISRYDTGVFYSAIVSDGVSNSGIISFKPSLAFL